MKKVLLLAYDSFAEFEITILITALDAKLAVCAPTNDPVTSNGGLRVLPDLAVAQVNPDDYDALVVPGGDPAPLLTDIALTGLIRGFDAKGKLIAAICGGPALLGAAGVLDKRSYTASLTPEDAAHTGVAGKGTMLPQTLVVDGNIITATGSNYLAFAEQVLAHLAGRNTPTPLTYFREPSLG